jgi:hypothetical protein
MRIIFLLLIMCGAVCATASLLPPKPAPKAGWIGVFPTLFNYQRTFLQPLVNKDKTVYQQSAKYVWSGNDFREATATLARDPQFKTAHTAATLTQAGAKEIKIGTKTAWFFAGKGKEALDKIIVPLGDDTALFVEGIGIAHKAFPTELASKFDLDKVAAALQQPPRTDFGRTLDAFKALKKGMSLTEVRDWVGEADGDIGSGIHILEYKLPDNSRVLIGFPSFDKLIYVTHQKNGETIHLVK